MIPTVLITGRDGQLGFELRRTLSPVSNIIAVDIDTVDLGDLDAVRKLVRDTRPTVIVNAAAYTAVDRAESERDIAHTLNGEVPGVLAEELKRVEGKLIVHYSTDYVFDGTATRPYTEDRDPSPISVYGQTKLAGERAVEQAGVPYAVLRTEWLYATRGANFLRTILRLARDGKPLRIVADQVGAPTWARMLAESSAIIIAFFLRASASEVNTLSGTYHVTAAGQTNWHDFARAILEEELARLQRLGKPLAWCETALASLQPIPASAYPLPARRPGYSVLSNEKVERVFGIHLPDWRDQLHLAFEDFDCPG
ncbi:MAG TPA: dTDP-4-dehydrorhamnose reductase [Terriglobales bacterium]|nr:dTDP-4-dehydrorhamnose reductase [Terriglobales bacterium]